MSRLTIDLTEQQHQSLKALAVLHGKTIKQYAIERLFPGDTDADQAWQELKTLLVKRIEEGRASTKTFDEIVEEEFAHEPRRA
ncbi:MAG: antitoxin [Betaproteobacteria bacterium]|nr:antitoxin [Betaproteobacteria bacterium]